ncbi:hypothetical protein P154DRAFT_530561 [Amniculicola lignicola CBS 123094]|uniref:Uncharacterized protein n=1 Tax=Amniculicola lignicola CBS 123094 TaxID=1392246 RepID=A0A6A5WXQ5_9PLEO|nr:hypothetical protein P154DRAFT_530561 [Amniculicola lignicola CBS 123094]
MPESSDHPKLHESTSESGQRVEDTQQEGYEKVGLENGEVHNLEKGADPSRSRVTTHPCAKQWWMGWDGQLTISPTSDNIIWHPEEISNRTAQNGIQLLDLPLDDKADIVLFHSPHGVTIRFLNCGLQIYPDIPDKFLPYVEYYVAFPEEEGIFDAHPKGAKEKDMYPKLNGDVAAENKRAWEEGF